MKRLKNKLLKKQEEKTPPSRITNETVAEHRERILAGGRKFKYPVQYARHKLVFNTVIISVAVIILLVAIGWWQLYPAQNTSGFMYRLTQIVPLPVAEVDGRQVRYSDYLMRYRSSMHFLQQQNMINLNSKDGARQVEHVKRQSLNEAETNAYAQKIAAQQNISVTSQAIDKFIKKEREDQRSSLSEEAFEKVVLKGFYDWSKDEYRHIVADTLLRQQVSFAIDKKAKARIGQAAAELKRGGAFEKVAAKYSDDVATKVRGGDVGFVPKNSQDPSGLVAAAKKMKKNQISEIIKGTDGYYIIKLLDTNKNQVRYARILVKLTEFDVQFKKIKADKKIKEYISVPESPEKPQQR